MDHGERQQDMEVAKACVEAFNKMLGESKIKNLDANNMEAVVSLIMKELNKLKCKKSVVM